jgi:hypothetical protein
MMSAWQLSVLDEVPERLVKFGRIRTSLSVVVVEDDDGMRVEARWGRKRVARIAIGYDRGRLPVALETAWRAAAEAAAFGSDAAGHQG